MVRYVTLRRTINAVTSAARHPHTWTNQLMTGNLRDVHPIPSVQNGSYADILPNEGYPPLHLSRQRSDVKNKGHSLYSSNMNNQHSNFINYFDVDNDMENLPTEPAPIPIKKSMSLFPYATKTGHLNSQISNRKFETNSPNERCLHSSTLYTQNVQGFNNTKMELLIDNMIAYNIDAYCIQETWLKGTTCKTVRGHRIFLHNIDEKKKNRDGITNKGRVPGGVAIIISPDYNTAWEKAGSLPAVTNTISTNYAGRFIGITLSFSNKDDFGKPKKGCFKLFLSSVYYPVIKQDHEIFIDELNPILSSIPRNCQHISGQDINANIGYRSTLSYHATLGPYGINNRNKKGRNVLSLFSSNGLKAVNTYYKHPEYATWTSFNKERTQHMLDIFAVSTETFKRITNCKVVPRGIYSDHSAVELTLLISSIRYKPSKLACGRINWDLIRDDPTLFKKYNKTIEEFNTPQIGNKNYWNAKYTTFNQHIIDAASQTIRTVTNVDNGWFQYSRHKLRPLYEQRDELLFIIRSSLHPPSLDTKNTLKALTNAAKDATSIAKASYSANLARDVHRMRINPKKAWDSIKKLGMGTQHHHKAAKLMNLLLPNQTPATNDKENLSVLAPHFEKVLNNTRPTVLSVIDQIQPRNIILSLDNDITWEELIKAVGKLSNDKAPGLNQVPPNAYKCLNNANLNTIQRFNKAYWDNTADYDEWHESQVVPVYKKGDTGDPNNYRGVSLMDIHGKIFSSIMTQRLFVILKLHGTTTQFGCTPGLGCQDGIFTLKTLLHLRHEHNLPTYVAYIDLVKAFDTVDHTLLFKILELYGAPPKFLNCIKRLYTNLIVVMKLGKEKATFKQTVGVRQGDCMAAVLFLFLITAFAETLTDEWEKHGITKPKFSRGTNSPRDTGQLISHPRNKLGTGTTFTLFNILYVDDGAFPFISRDELRTGTNLLYNHFKKFGLQMHIGSLAKKSKTECVFYPPPGFFKPKKILQITPHDFIINNLGIITKEKKESAKVRRKREDEAYDSLPETTPICINEGFITFTRQFKYLGTTTSYSLRDDNEIIQRIASASASMGALRPYYNNTEVDLYSKYLIFQALTINILLWGCESWALRESQLRSLNVFLHRSIRSILQIKMCTVKEDKIRNSSIRSRFYNCPTVQNLIAIRQLTFIGKVVRNRSTHPPSQLLTAWCNHPRKRGGVLTNNKKIIIKHLKLIIPDTNKTGSLKTWAFHALDQNHWSHLINSLRHPNIDPPEGPPRCPPSAENTPPASPIRPRPQAQTNTPPTNPQTSPPQNHIPSPLRRNNYNASGVGINKSDSLKALGLQENATEREMKIKYRTLARVYHPDKHDPLKTGISNESAGDFFKLINNAHSFLRGIL